MYSIRKAVVYTSAIIGSVTFASMLLVDVNWIISLLWFGFSIGCIFVDLNKL